MFILSSWTSLGSLLRRIIAIPALTLCLLLLLFMYLSQDPIFVCSTVLPLPTSTALYALCSVLMFYHSYASLTRAFEPYRTYISSTSSSLLLRLPSFLWALSICLINFLIVFPPFPARLPIPVTYYNDTMFHLWTHSSYYPWCLSSSARR